MYRSLRRDSFSLSQSDVSSGFSSDQSSLHHVSKLKKQKGYVINIDQCLTFPDGQGDS